MLVNWRVLRNRFESVPEIMASGLSFEVLLFRSIHSVEEDNTNKGTE